ncbi:uncharacterized protein [Hetaerina americana]|uniref:uncharacterized protein n=1 Tax=Hetaerina americana TaxID=62018 RepID=UPI003A7F5308
MENFYEDIPLPSRGFAYTGPRPLMSTVFPHPSPNHENFNRFPAVGGNNFCHHTNPNLTHFGRNQNEGNKFEIYPPHRNIPKTRYRWFDTHRPYSQMNVQPNVSGYNTGYHTNSRNDVHNFFQANLMQYKTFIDSRDDGYPKKKKSPEQDEQNDAEAIKKSNLAAKLKKSLEAFKKNPSYKKKNLSIINKSDGSGPSRYTSEIQPCFRWDLPLTVDDLKTIRRCPSRSGSNDQSNPQHDVIETRDYSSDTEPINISSPDITYIKCCRKRKSSESMDCAATKRRVIGHRRRHRSASPKLCLENNSIPIVGQRQLPQSPLPAEEILNSGSVGTTTNESSPSKPKSVQSSNVMQLLGIKRRELDELVNQPRSPRVQFMLRLLMKRHKELLLQRAMQSRISSAQNEGGTSSQSEELDPVQVSESPSFENKPIKLEGMGASDTIDQLSNILLESSLAVDISNLPQELIDQLGTFLEMGADSGNHNGNIDECSDSDPNILTGESSDKVVSEECRNRENGVFGVIEYSSSDASRYGGNITRAETNIMSQSNFLSPQVESQAAEVDHCGEQQFNVNKQTCNEQTESSYDSHVNSSTPKVMRMSQKREVTESGSLSGNGLYASRNIQQRIDHGRARNSSVCAEESSEPPPSNIWEYENTSTSEAYPKQNIGRFYEQCSHSIPLQPQDDESTEESEEHTIAKLWSIDAKILELMEEKKILYQKILRNKVLFHNTLDRNNSLSGSVQNKNTANSALAPVFENASTSSSQSTIQAHGNRITPISNVTSHPSVATTAMNSVNQICHSQSSPNHSMAPEDFSKDIAAEPEVIPIPISPKGPKVSSLQWHEKIKRNCEKLNVNNCTPPDNYHNESRSNAVNISLNKDHIMASSRNSNSNREVVNSSPRGVPANVELDPDIVEIIDEPVEIIYDSNVCKATDNRNEGEFIGHKDAVLALKVAGNYLFACCSDFCVHCYEIETCKLIQTYKGHTEKVTCLHVELSGTGSGNLYSGSHDHHLKQFDIKKGKLQCTKILAEPIQCMGEGWGFLFLGTKKGKIEKYSLKNCNFANGLSSLNHEIMAIETSKEGPRKVLIVACRRIPMIVRDANTGLLLRTINEEMLNTTTYSMCEYQGLVFAGTSMNGVVACDFTNGKIITNYTGCGSIVSVKVKNDLLYAACYDGKIYIYDLKSSSPKHKIDASTKMLLCMEQKDDMIFAGDVNGQLKFWKMPPPETMRRGTS